MQAKQSQATTSKLSSVISFGSTVLGSIFGGKKLLSAGNISKAATAAKSVGRTMQSSESVEIANEKLQTAQNELQILHDKLKKETDELTERYESGNLKLESVELKPTKTNINVRLVGLIWLPLAKDKLGTLTKAY